MSVQSILPALLIMITLFLGSPALAGAQSGSQTQEPTGPVVHEDYCPG
jgi:hypothetical protein